MVGSAPLWLWILFHLLLLSLLGVDHAVTRAARNRPANHSAISLTLLWIVAALLFSVLIAHALRPQFAAEYLAGYSIEEALSIDNMFVFLLVFRSFGLGTSQQHKVLFWGVLGAIVMRAGMIAAGLTLVRLFGWINYIFGVILLVAAIRLLLKSQKKQPKQQPRWVMTLARHLPLAKNSAGNHFFVRENGVLRCTHLFLVLVVIELTDLFFAMDSIPAVLAVSHHPFVVYSSNVFAVMGLRSLYFVIAGLLEQFHLLHYGLAVILLFVGAKMLLSHFVTIPIGISLGVLATVIALTIILSLLTRPARLET